MPQKQCTKILIFFLESQTLANYKTPELLLAMTIQFC